MSVISEYPVFLFQVFESCSILIAISSNNCVSSFGCIWQHWETTIVHWCNCDPRVIICIFKIS